jgi:transcriptional regulator with XRE-family HTH domain
VPGNPADPSELGAFLKARRSELTPREVGLPEGGTRRRVAGLRREEIAQLAAISVDYYTRLEQGRISASGAVLASLARVLRLDDDQRTYLYELAGSRASARGRRRPQHRVRPQMERILGHLTGTPAIVMTPIMDVLAWNPLAAALMINFSQLPEVERNFLRLIFTDARMRALYPDWEGLARACVAYVRMEAAERPDDLRLATLVGELSVQDADFRRWWAGHHVALKRRGTRTYDHPVVGELTLDWDTLTSDADPELQLIVYTAEPGSPSEEALRLLASRVAGRARPGHERADWSSHAPPRPGVD